jgi:hypothetical protein
MRHMVIRACSQTGGGGIIHSWVSLPHVPALVDNLKYWEPHAVTKSDDATELRRYRARGPTLRSLVKLALKCESAEEMGKQLKRRFDRSLVRRGIDPNRGRSAKAERELDRLLGD